MNAPTTRNITRVFRLATDDDRKSGRYWYSHAAGIARNLAYPSCHPGALESGAALIAVLSPRASWKRNVQLAYDADKLFRAGASRNEFVAALGTTGANALKAWRILQGEDPDDVVSGPKVTAFYHAIAHPNDARGVAIDRHAHDIAHNVVTDDATRGRNLARVGGYQSYVELYRRAAKAINADGRYGSGWTAIQVQAVTWVYWRRERAAANHG